MLKVGINYLCRKIKCSLPLQSLAESSGSAFD